MDIVKEKVELDSLLQEILEEHELPGATAGYFIDESEHYSAHGTIDPVENSVYQIDSIMRIGCSIKLFTATQIMMLKDQSLLDLDRPIVEYMSDLKNIASPWLDLVTTRQLLNHQSGFAANYFVDGDGAESDQVAQVLGALPEDRRFMFKPGSLCAYSTFGYIVLAHLVESIRGKHWLEDLEERVFIPLGIDCKQLRKDPAQRELAPFGRIIREDYQSSDHHRVPTKIVPGDGGSLALSVKDLLSFGRMHLNGGVTQSGQRLLKQSSVQEMQTQLGQPTGPWGGLNGLAYGWLALSNGAFSFPGDGTRNHVLIRIDPVENVALAVVANYHSATILFEELWRKLVPKPVSPPALEKEAPKPSTDEIVGSYYGGAATLTIYQSTDNLMIKVDSDALSKHTDYVVDAKLTHMKGNHFLCMEIGNFCNSWFLDIGDTGKINYLWNGVTLMKKIT